MLLHVSLHGRGVGHKSDGDVGGEQVRDRVVVARADEAYGFVRAVREGGEELVGGVYLPAALVKKNDSRPAVMHEKASDSMRGTPSWAPPR